MSRTRRIRGYVRQNAVAFLALFVALGGTGAYAANTIGSSDIIDGQVRWPDIGVGQVLGSRITDETVKTADVANDSLSGADINEATLGKTPAATNADRLAGVAAKPVVRLVAEGAPYGDACEADPPRLATFCRGDDGTGFQAEPWANYGGESQPAGFYKDAFGIVHVEGFVKSRTSREGAQTIFILPPGYRPATSRAFAVIGRGTDLSTRRDVASVDVTPGGKVVLTRHPDPDAQYREPIDYLSLDGIAFRTG